MNIGTVNTRGTRTQPYEASDSKRFTASCLMPLASCYKNLKAFLIWIRGSTSLVGLGTRMVRFCEMEPNQLINTDALTRAGYSSRAHGVGRTGSVPAMCHKSQFFRLPALRGALAVAAQCVGQLLHRL